MFLLSVLHLEEAGRGNSPTPGKLGVRFDDRRCSQAGGLTDTGPGVAVLLLRGAGGVPGHSSCHFLHSLPTSYLAISLKEEKKA